MVDKERKNHNPTIRYAKGFPLQYVRTLQQKEKPRIRPVNLEPNSFLDYTVKREAT